MSAVATDTSRLSESDFADMVESLIADPGGRDRLALLLREDHSLYDQRGAATVVRMRGWVLEALARSGVTDSELLLVLEELDTGVDPYPVAAAARALRSYGKPVAEFAPFIIRAIGNIRYHDEPVSFEEYGEYATSSEGTSPLLELFATLEWLGPRAGSVLSDLESLRERGGLSRKLLPVVDRALGAIRGIEGDVDGCCSLPDGLSGFFSWSRGSRRDCEPIEKTVFEDHDGESVTFGELFYGHPSILVFFYTRCDNPLKCSLTITKLGRLQKLIESRGLAGQICTAAITYDPSFDLPERLRAYGRNRGARMDTHNRLLRSMDGMGALRGHLRLGVNFIESLVNRHRVEVYVLDREGGIAATFERIHWDEERVLESAAELLNETEGETGIQPPAPGRTAPQALGALASAGVAFFPKCPVCWSAYLSVFGIAGLEQIPYPPWLLPVLAALMAINLVSVWRRGRATGRMSPFHLVTLGAIAIIASKSGVGLEGLAIWGIVLTLVGSLFSAFSVRQLRARSPAA